MSVLKWKVEEFEGLWAVVKYNGSRFNLPRQMLPAGVQKGDVLTVSMVFSQADADQRAAQKKKSV